MSDVAAAAEPLAAGWSALRAFFREGVEPLHRATEAFLAAEGQVRALRDPTRLTIWLLGFSTALRYSRRPEPMEVGLERARELVNVVLRTQGEAATIPYRTHVEAILLDLADVVPAQADAYLSDGLQSSERTVRLARGAAQDESLAPALASRGDLLRRRGPAGDRRAARRAVALHQEAQRRWVARDPYGRAQAALGFGQALLAAGEAGRAALLGRESLAVFAKEGDRYHQAAARLLVSRALFALGRDEALEEQAQAVAIYRALGCRWECSRAEGAF